MSSPTRVAILGSTGSIGSQTLDVIGQHVGRFVVHALAAGSDSAAFRGQVQRWRPAVAAVSRATGSPWPFVDTRLLAGEEGLVEVATDPAVDLVVVATSGVVSIRPTLAALGAGKRVALANKEVLVSAGHLVVAAARRAGAVLLPVDSEHNAIWQCLQGECPSRVASITLTASGGAFRDVPVEDLDRVTPWQALQHPTWRMGPKVTVDSATLMNKGLEIIEAHWLFGVPIDRVDVVIHRESIVHSLVTFVDGSVKAQLAVPDMRLPIQYALFYPERVESAVEPLDLVRLARLSFTAVDPRRYPALQLVREAGARGGTYPSVLNAANEAAVHLFLDGAIPFTHIVRLVAEVLDRHTPVENPTLDQVLDADAWARQTCLDLATARVP
ncbi:MAG TPA: 1-deoxy-D-xylulose-5-phosphate reductoisomerase [Chloroflexota bacterium]